MSDSLNLAIVGEAVQSYWPENLCDASMTDQMAVKSGTSYATPIAASLAAFLLLFVQRNLDADAVRKIKKFKYMKRAIRAV
jgi:hypothetical protein